MRLILLSFILLCLFSSCKKENSHSFLNILGSWQWTYSSSMDGDTVRPSSGAVVTLVLNINSSYSLSLNNTEVSSGNFSTLTEEGISFVRFSDYLIADRLFVSPNNAYFIKDGSLMLYFPVVPAVVGVITDTRFTKVR